MSDNSARDLYTEKEFRRDIARGISTLVSACIKRFGGTWLDYMPRDTREGITYMVTVAHDKCVTETAIVDN